MKANMMVVVLLAFFCASACDNSGSRGSASSSKTVSDCRGDVERAVRGAGSDERAMMRAGDKALEDCMAGN
jgi:hypothetical protein